MARQLARHLLLAGLVAAPALAAPPPDLPKAVRAAVGDDGMQRVEIVGGSYWFRPEHVVVKANVPVVLTVRKQPGIIPHTFVLRAPQAGIDVKIDMASEPKTLRFTPTRAGGYAYYCDKSGILGKHRMKGMEGLLEIVE